MKKGLLIFALIVSLCSFGSVSEARRDIAGDTQGDVHILCCFQDGQCLKTRKRRCEYKKAIRVQDCKECPGVWGQGAPPAEPK